MIDSVSTVLGAPSATTRPPEIITRRSQNCAARVRPAWSVYASATPGATSRSEAGVPFVRNIPFLGRLFSRNVRHQEATNLLIMITGKIMLFEELEKDL